MEDNDSEMSRGRRLNLLCIPWALTVVATFPGIFYPFLLPAGLYRLFGIRETDSITNGWWLAMGWLVYIGLTVAAVILRRRVGYWIVYGVLCLLLALNCVGCRAFWSDLSQIR